MVDKKKMSKCLENIDFKKINTLVHLRKFGQK